jgi:hypothetical protein
VLADFNAGARKLLGTDARSFEARHGKGEFWRRLARHGDFYATLPKMADADELFAAVRHLNPTILTGLPIGKWAARRKCGGRPSISRACRSSPAWPATSTDT